MTKTAKMVGFIETMDCLALPKILKAPEWTYEIKLDGFRAVKQHGKVTLYSRRGNILNTKFPYIATALRGLEEETILEGELVALDAQGRSVFNLPQHFRSAEAQIRYYTFDILAMKGKNLTQLPLAERRQILNKIAPVNNHVSLAAVFAWFGG
jgi:bifunctional non-homologous end joining protein LigD